MHGVRILEQPSPLVPISAPETSVIGIVGTAPQGSTAIQVVTSKAQAETLYGPENSEFTLTKHLNAIFDQGSAKVLAVNVFDPLTMSLQVTDEVQIVAKRRLFTTYFPLPGTIVLRTAIGGGGTLMVLNTDYKIGRFGEIILLNPAIADTVPMYISYKRIDATTIVSSVINGSGGTGLSAFNNVVATHGITPNIMIAPGFSEIPAVGAELLAVAKSFRAVACVDMVYGLTKDQAIASRVAGGDSDYSDPDCVVVYPWFSKPNLRDELRGIYNADKVAYSAIWAGIVAKNDATRGYEWSPSNIPISGSYYPSAYLAGKGLDDATSDMNQLNEAGIVTYMPLSGIRVWGNRTTAYPASTAADESFVAVRRVENIIHRMILNNSLPFVGRPLTQVQIDTIKNSIQQALNVMIGQGRLIDGKCEYLLEQNSPVQLAAGQVTFQITILPPSPAELIIFQSVVDPSLSNIS